MAHERNVWKLLLSRAGETVLSLALVMVCFLAFMGILGMSFPQGTGLGALLQFEERAQLERTSRLRMDLDPELAEPIVAQLTSVTRKVLDKHSHAITWNQAQSGTPLENRHAIQTFERSGASISFGLNDQLRLGENSLVIVRLAEQSRGGTHKRASLLMLGGEVEGRLGAGASEQVEIEIATSGASARVASKSRSDTVFRVESHGDHSSTFSVLEGTAEVEALGKLYAVGADEALSVGPTGTPVQRFPLPAAPTSVSPDDGKVYTFNSGPPEVRFSWEPVAKARKYRVQVALDEAFENVVSDVTVDDPAFVHGYLEEGHYYWRVSGVHETARGRASAPHRIEVRYDDVAPRLEVAFPQEPLAERTCTLRGTTEPAARIFVGDHAVEADERGIFEIAVDLLPGPNLVVVEAFDAAGNVSYSSSYVHARY